MARTQSKDAEHIIVLGVQEARAKSGNQIDSFWGNNILDPWALLRQLKETMQVQILLYVWLMT